MAESSETSVTEKRGIMSGVRRVVVRVLTVSAALGLTSGCDGDPPEPPVFPLIVEACAPGAGVERPELLASTRGMVRIRDEIGGEAAGEPRGRVTASFGRLGVDTGTPAVGLPLDSACVGLTSRPSPATDTEDLAVERLSVDGTTLGRVEVASLGPGRYAYTGVPLLSGGVLQVEASGGTFPAFREAISPVAPLELSAPDPGTPIRLEEGLRVRWTPGDGEAMFVEVAPVFAAGPSPSGGQVICRVADEGCLDLSESALVFLGASGADRFRLTIRRERTRLAQVPGAEVLIEVASGTGFPLEVEPR